MPRPILFVAGQPGAAAFLAPIWRRWLDRDAQPSWRVILHPSAKWAVEKAGLKSLPLLDVEDDGKKLFARMCNEWRPNLIVTSATYWEKEIEATMFAREKDILTARFVDTWYGYNERTFKVSGPDEVSDNILVIDDRAIDEAVSEGLPADRLLAVGHPAWEMVRPLPAADDRVVMFVSQPVKEELGDRLGYTQYTAWDLVQKAAARRPDLFERLIWAPHPRKKTSPEIRSENVQVIESGQAGLARAGTVIGLFASVMVDAVLCGRRVISIQPNSVGLDMCSLSRHGFIPRVHTVDELLNAMELTVPDASGLRRSLAGSCDRLESFLLGKVS